MGRRWRAIITFMYAPAFGVVCLSDHVRMRCLHMFGSMKIRQDGIHESWKLIKEIMTD